MAGSVADNKTKLDFQEEISDAFSEDHLCVHRGRWGGIQKWTFPELEILKLPTLFYTRGGGDPHS